MSAQNAIISASYFSLIHESNTEVSNPPEYARTIFIVYPIPNRELTQIIANRKEESAPPVPSNAQGVRPEAQFPSRRQWYSIHRNSTQTILRRTSRWLGGRG